MNAAPNKSILAMFEIYLDKSGISGRGVFAARDYFPGEVIEICPVVLIPHKQEDGIVSSVLKDYIFTWPGPRQKMTGTTWRGICIVLGYGMLYNHSFRPNAKYDIDRKGLTVIFKARKPIKKGDEITHNYYWPTNQEKKLKRQ
jgi:SET domain-containing protein